MHELGIANSMIDIIIETANSNNAKKVNKVTARIGRLAGVDIHSLQFAYDAVKEDYEIIKDSVLFIEDVPVTGICGDCGKKDTYEEMFFSCSGCGSFNVTLLSGEELTVADIEVD